MILSAAMLVGAYLIGSISFSLIAVWTLERVDLRTLGSGNAGATNVLRTSGRWAALAVLLLDIGKGLLPVRFARSLELPAAVVAGTALAVVLGHVFPLYFGFRGGKGVATGLGAFLGFVPLAAGVALLVFVVVVTTTRYVSVGSMAATLSAPPFAWAFARAGWTEPLPPLALALAGACSLVVVAMHWPNLKRLAAGRERRLGARRRD
ncbi:MAG: glycerol-3-phosphate 1-O-acyltransferase PlsY [Acidobacteria bacterium]|nr:glycerol-3-phosphate 1-O-acyltransferase PlsY [Acidobacteriota bacterium]